jgi:alkanesulfonate monooxygenase SsuD/methylene tetrahydromethanopterin reductase-like flavin-dependent oxidoreductase (luciferase family)
MPHRIRFWIYVHPVVPWHTHMRHVLHAEELGFDAVTVADHFGDFAGRRIPFFEMWSQLAAIATATTTVRLAPMVAQIPLRNPAMLALQALTVDHISNGRLDLGLGTGLTVDPSYRMMGLENWSVKERVTRFAEYVEVVHRLLTQEEVTYRGRYYQLDAARLCPRPVQSPRPPIMIAAMGQRMLNHAARHADIWNFMSFANTFEAQMEEAHQRVVEMDACCVAIGRDPNSLRRSFYMHDPNGQSRHGLLQIYDSEEVFTQMIEQVLSLGIQEVALIYPIREEQMPVFERAARNILPTLKAKHAS